MVDLKNILFAGIFCISNGNIEFTKDEHYGYLKLNMEHKKINRFKELIILQEFFGAGSDIQVYSDYGCVFVKVTFWLKNINYNIKKQTITLSRNQESDIYKYGGVCPHCNAMT